MSATGDTVVTRPDPTAAVRESIAAAVTRLDDLRVYSERLATLQVNHAEAMAEMRARHQRDLATAESYRIDSIRKTDREEALATAANLRAAQESLANATQSIAAALRGSKESADQKFNDRLSALELALSAGAGKGAGMEKLWGWLVGIAALAFAFWNSQP